MRTRHFVAALLLVMGSAGAGAEPAEPSGLLTLEGKIPLGNVSSRIDHLAIDLQHRRLFVAELGNNSLGVIDLAAARVLRTIAGFREPQGVGYEPSTDTLYVANAGDGSVHVLRGEDLSPLGRVDLGSDADNVRIDAIHRRVLVGHADGALAIIDPASRAKIGDIRLPAHPEAFELVEKRRQGRPSSICPMPVGSPSPIWRRVRCVPLRPARLPRTSRWPATRTPSAFLSGFADPRCWPPTRFREEQLVARGPICADADDLFADAKRHRICCGAGVIDVLAPAGDRYARLARISTASGARTSLFVPELDRLYVAARAGRTEPAAIWVFRPSP
jgi:hypothetical protein